MDQKTFTSWFYNVFFVEVKSYIKFKNLSEKALLIMDDAQAHPLNELADEGIKCVFLLANMSCLIQPMEQGMIENFTQQCRKLFLQNYVSCDMSSN